MGRTVILTGIVEEEDGQFVSTCCELGTSSCGDTVQEAFANLEEAIWVHLTALEEVGELDRVLRERNISDVESILAEHSIPLNVPVGKMFKAIKHELPVLA